MHCEACGKQLNLEARFCDHCGTAVQIPQPEARATLQSVPTLAGSLGSLYGSVKNGGGTKAALGGFFVVGICAFLIMTFFTADRDVNKPAVTAELTSEQKATIARQATVAKMTDAELLKSAKGLLAHTNVAQISEGDQALAMASIKEYERRNPVSHGQTDALTKRLVAVELARQLKKSADDMDARPPSDLAEIECRMAIKGNLRNPDNAKFASYSDDYVKYLGKGTFHVQVKANAENGFGGRVNSVFDCRVQCLRRDSCALTALKELN
jgi:hypothetical protein